VTPAELTSMKGKMRESAQQLLAPLDNPPFEYSVSFADTYDDLFSGHLEPSVPIEELLERAASRGRVLIHAPAGSGKSRVLTQLFDTAARGALALFVNLRDWTPRLFNDWDAVGGNEVYRMALMLNHLTTPRLEEADVARLVGASRCYVFIDGLNEIPTPYARGVLSCADALARRQPRFGVLVADRLTRRDVDESTWAVATLPPLPIAQVAHLLDVEEPIPDFVLRPFFLNMALQRGLNVGNEADWFTSFFTDQLGLAELQLDAVAASAYAAYRDEHSRSFSRGAFEATAGLSTSTLLLQAGVLISHGEDSIYFEHHLFHDYLAGRYLAAHSAEWDSSVFDAVTFRASSFDVLSLSLEQIIGQENGDEFIRLVFDWNPYGPAYVIAKSAEGIRPRVSRDMAFAMAAMLAERRGDAVRASAQTATDALNLLSPVVGASFLELDTLAQLLDLVRTYEPSSPEFRDWKTVFVGGDSVSSHQLVLEVIEGDSLLGWTAANVLRRSDIEDDDQRLLREACGNASEVVRWRSVHALGAHPSASNLEAVLQRLSEDPAYWVKYGATRAAVEMAGFSSAIRGEVQASLLGHLGDILEGGVQNELASSLDLRILPEGWLEFAEPLLEELWLRADSVEAQDKWRGLAHRLELRSGAPA
jgi:hypothetical protein